MRSENGAGNDCKESQMTARIPSNRRLIRFPVLRAILRLIRRIVMPEARAIHRLQRHQAEPLLQPYPTTGFDRHPALFDFARQRLAGKGDVRLLSYGCSTGEEPISLARYLPNAEIDAIDINPRSIAIARRRAVKLKCRAITFTVAGQPPAVEGYYDAVFCLSVLRHGQLDAERPKSCSEIFSFAKYEAAIVALDRTIRSGGLLFIWGSNFHFSDSKIAKRYRPLEVSGMRPHLGAFFGPDDALLESRGADQFVFEKLR